MSEQGPDEFERTTQKMIDSARQEIEMLTRRIHGFEVALARYRASMTLGVEQGITKEEVHAAAVVLGRLGGKKSGPERAANMTPGERSDGASKTAIARWNKCSGQSGACSVCGVLLDRHRRCGECGILVGPGHQTKTLTIGGSCRDCAKSHRGATP